ncbi:MAG: ribbon-helix-helix protein, CopG family [Actinomycetota bacterium]
MAVRDRGSARLDSRAVRLPDGSRITERRAQRWAREAERRGPGRPSLDGGSSVSPDIKARVPAVLRARLMVLADKEGVPVSEIVRRALESYVDAS